MNSTLIKDTTKEEREQLVRESLGCGAGCKVCTACSLGSGLSEMYQAYIEGTKEIAEINAEYNARYIRN
jgi:hypothetical protein